MGDNDLRQEKSGVDSIYILAQSSKIRYIGPFDFRLSLRFEFMFVDHSPLFFIPLNDSSLAPVGSGLESCSGLGMSCHFVGDQPNGLLRYLLSVGQLRRSDWPLVLFGASGTGKTAVGLALTEQLANRFGGKPVMMSADSFRRRYWSSIETDSASRFRKNLANASVFFLDDLHFLADHENVQLELASVLDTRQKSGRPSVLVVGASCLSLPQLHPSLASRLCDGLCLPVQKPGRDARRIVICDISQSLGLHLSSDALDYLAEVLCLTYPQLRAFFNQLVVWLDSPDCGSVRKLDKESVSQFVATKKCSKSKTISAVLAEVCRVFQIKPLELKSQSRKKSAVLARSVATYLLRTIANITFARIGDLLGGRDHSTVIHSYNRITSLVNGNEGHSADLVGTIDLIRARLLEKQILDVEDLC